MGETDIVDPMLDCFVPWPIFEGGTGQGQKGEVIPRSPDMRGMSHVGTFVCQQQAREQTGRLAGDRATALMD